MISSLVLNRVVELINNVLQLFKILFTLGLIRHSSNSSIVTSDLKTRENKPSMERFLLFAEAPLLIFPLQDLIQNTKFRNKSGKRRKIYNFN